MSTANAAPIASEDEDGASTVGPEPAGGVLEDAPARRHRAMNPTTRKQACKYHRGVVVKRSKLRSAPVLTPCWRCLEVRRKGVGWGDGAVRCVGCVQLIESNRMVE